MSEFDEINAREIANQIEAQWLKGWSETSSPHEDTVTVETGGAWLYMSVQHCDGGRMARFKAQLYSTAGPGVTWDAVEERGWEPHRVATAIIKRLGPWLPAVQREAKIGRTLQFELHQCTAELFDHTGTCGFWTISGPHDVQSISHWTGARHVTMSVIEGTGDEPRKLLPYAEFIGDKETEWSRETRTRFAALP